MLRTILGLPAVLMVTSACCCGESFGWGFSKWALLPKSHDPVSLSNWNAEQPIVAMHSDVQCRGDLEWVT